MIRSSRVLPPLLISLTAAEKKLVKAFKKQFEALGTIFTVTVRK